MTKKTAFIFLFGVILLSASVLSWRGEKQNQPTTRLVKLASPIAPENTAESAASAPETTASVQEQIQEDVQASGEEILFEASAEGGSINLNEK